MSDLPYIIQLRQGATEDWNANNPILRAGEMGIEFLPDGKISMKAGNGYHPWRQLPYVSGEGKGGVDYSTQEQDTGLKSTNGSPVYQKTIVVQNWNGAADVPHGISGLTSVLNIQASVATE